MDKKYAIFDMDGTLVDSMGFWKQLGVEYLTSRGISREAAEGVQERVKAMTMTECAELFRSVFHLPQTSEEIAGEINGMMDRHYQEDVPLKPGVAAYLAGLKAQGVRMCVATATAEPLARACLERLGVAQYFDFLLSCEEVGTGKDSPTVFLEAARRLGADPREVAVFEDAPYALDTAAKAGFWTVAVYDIGCGDRWQALAAQADETILDWRTPMKPSERLYQAARPVWDQCLSHPFVTGIGDGTLPVEKFQYFMLQDYLYLFDYARVFAIGVVKARQPELMRIFSKNVDTILHGEMKIHRGYMARLGITEEQVFAVEPALDNLSYSNYMLSVSHAGGPREIVAAILACSWSYAEIGQTLAAIPGAAEHPFYGEWIQGYASEEYAATNQSLIELMDRLAEGSSEEELAHLTDIFVNCSRYEKGFWDMAWEMRP